MKKQSITKAKIKKMIRIHLNIDETVVRQYKRVATAEGITYQKLMRAMLRLATDV